MGLKKAMRKAAGMLVELPVREAGPPYGLLKPDNNADLDLSEEALPSIRSEEALPSIRSEETLPSLRSEEAAPQLAASTHESNGTGLTPVLSVQSLSAQLQNAPKQAQISTAVLTPNGIDFDAVYRLAGLTEVPFSAEKLHQMLESLPLDLPPDTRRATIHAMMNTLGDDLGATPKAVVEDATQKLNILRSFTQFIRNHSVDAVTRAETEIAELEAQIEIRREIIAKTKEELSHHTEKCVAKSQPLKEVVQFFNLQGNEVSS